MQFCIKQLDIFPQMRMSLAIQAIKIKCWIVRMWNYCMWLEGWMLIRKGCFCFRVMGSLFTKLLVQNEKKKKSMKSGLSLRSQIKIAIRLKVELFWMMAILQNLRKFKKSRIKKFS